MSVECFMVTQDPDLHFYMLEDEDEWRGPVTEAEVPEEWEGLSPAFVMPDGTVVQSHELPPGAIYDYMQSPVEDVPEAYADRAVNGQYLVCVLPDGHHWQIDSYANNCDRGRDGHHCWIRHGEPPKLTIDKGGDTCSAGSGSIQTGTWHGFLRDGMLVT